MTIWSQLDEITLSKSCIHYNLVLIVIVKLHGLYLFSGDSWEGSQNGTRLNFAKGRPGLAFHFFIILSKDPFSISASDVTEALYELELTIRRVKVYTAPDGRVMDLFFITDTRFVFNKSSCSMLPKFTLLEVFWARSFNLCAHYLI